MRRKLGLGLLVAVLAAAAAQTPEATLGAALHEERVTGNLQAAIDGHRKVLAMKGVPRPVAAQAQYHIGLCYEKLGNQEARKAFESVVRNFADQKDIASQARARLAAMSGDTGGVRARLLWGGAGDVWGRASADGRYFSYPDWSSCDVGLRDLLTGESRKVTKYDGCFKAMGEVWGSAVSPGGKQIAFGYYRYRGRDGDMELRIIASDGTGEKTLMRGGGLSYADPQSWSPDGRWIAVVTSFRDASVEENGIALVSADSGQVRRLPVKRRPTNPTFSPDGKWLAYSVASPGAAPTLLARPVEGEGAEQTVQENAVMMGWTPDGTALLFSRRRGEAHDLYLLPVSEGKAAGAPTPIYSATDVGTGPAGVTRQGSLLFGAYNSRAESRILPWTGEGSLQSAPVFSTPATVRMAWVLWNGAAHFSNDGRRLFVVNSQNGITIRDLASGGERTISPQLKSWSRARWAHDDACLLLYGTDANDRTGVYRVDDMTGSAAFLTELPQISSFEPSRDGKTIYYGTGQALQARDLATGQDKTLFERGGIDLRLSHDGNRLSVRGGTDLAVLDLRNGRSRELYRSPEQSATGFFGMNWSADDRQIVTIVRLDGLADKMELWLFSPEGGEPKRQAIPAGLFGLSFSPDGKYVATTSRTQRGQLWALENFLPGKK